MLDENGALESTRTACLVDDEVDITLVIKKGLEQGGFTVYDYNDPNMAWGYIKEKDQNCTIVISDVRMPSMSGFESCRRVKAGSSSIPTTAFEINQSEVSEVLPNDQADGFFRKPMSLKKLRELIMDSRQRYDFARTTN